MPTSAHGHSKLSFVQDRFNQFLPFFERWSGSVVALTLIAIGVLGIYESHFAKDDGHAEEEQETMKMALAGKRGGGGPPSLLLFSLHIAPALRLAAPASAMALPCSRNQAAPHVVCERVCPRLSCHSVGGPVHMLRFMQLCTRVPCSAACVVQGTGGRGLVLAPARLPVPLPWQTRLCFCGRARTEHGCMVKG